MKRFMSYINIVILLALIMQMPVKNNAMAAEKADTKVIYVSPNGSGDGAIDNETNLLNAIDMAKPGDAILMKNGIYEFSETIIIDASKNGNSNAYIYLLAESVYDVVLDFSSQPTGASFRGINFNASYWYVNGLVIQGAGDNGICLAGSFNVFDRCVFRGNRDTGLQISRNSNTNDINEWPSYNLILNCTSCNNSDPTGENADGFAPKLTCGEGNLFYGCLSYNNVDDGWDMYAKSATGPIGVNTLVNCVAFRNGQTEDGVFTPESDGNGFKLGGGGIGTPHVIINCLSFENKNTGFTDNNNPSAISLINCTSFNNDRAGNNKGNFNVYRCKNAFFFDLLSYSDLVSSKDNLQNGSGGNILYHKQGKWYYITEGNAKIDLKASTPAFTQKSVCVNDLTNLQEKTDAFGFISSISPEIGSDFDNIWREESGALKISDFAQTENKENYLSCGNSAKIGANLTGTDFFAGNLDYEQISEHVSERNLALIKAINIFQSSIESENNISEFEKLAYAVGNEGNNAGVKEEVPKDVNTTETKEEVAKDVNAADKKEELTKDVNAADKKEEITNDVNVAETKEEVAKDVNTTETKEEVIAEITSETNTSEIVKETNSGINSTHKNESGLEFEMEVLPYIVMVVSLLGIALFTVCKIRRKK